MIKKHTDKIKNEIDSSINSLLDNKLIKIGFVVAITMGGIFILSNAIRTFTHTVHSFKNLAEAFKR